MEQVLFGVRTTLRAFVHRLFEVPEEEDEHSKLIGKSPKFLKIRTVRGSRTSGQAGRSEAPGDEMSRDDPIGSLNHPEESSKNQQDQSPTITDQADIEGDSQPRSIGARVHAQNYLADRKIFELFNFLIGHLLVNEPDEPIDYLYDLLDRCMLFRSGLTEPPLLFDTRHIKSLFQSLDPSGLGNISLDRYKTGMETLGIANYDARPRESMPGRVDKNTFTNEAKRCLVRMLSEMIGKSL